MANANKERTVIRGDGGGKDGNGGDNDNKKKGGKLLVQRCPSSSAYLHNACTAACNALQEPGILTTLTLSKWGVDRNSSSCSTRMPHIYDILAVLYSFRSIESSTSTQTSPSKHIIMTGAEAEAEAFMTLHPKFFFVSCRVLMDIRSDGGHGPFVNVVFPVVWKMGHYYVIVGEGDTPVYRIHHPDKFFFTFKGTLVLKNLLSRYYRGLGNEFDFNKNDEGKHAPYYIPNFMTDGCPSERWDSAEDGSIAKQLLLPLVHEPVVPVPHLASVQVIQLNDTHNIVDIKFPFPRENYKFNNL